MLSKRPSDSLADGPYAKRTRLSDASDSGAVQVSAEVAGDFKDSLSDLLANDRYQISNLTIIAKENTEHALAISDVLLNHIKAVPPTRKLPALYVLDSIVKNVGTPYTIFLSRNLFRTYMDAYTLVDSLTRKQMESMLRTWKDPIPGSMDPKPVFPVDTTKNIENALNRARSVFVEQQQKNGQGLHQQRPPTHHSLPPRPSVVPSPGSHGWAGHSPALQQPSHPNSHFHSPFPSSAPQHPPQSHQQSFAQTSTDYQYGLPQSGLQNYQSPAPLYGQSQYPPPPIRSPQPLPGYQSSFQPPPPQGYQPPLASQFQPPPPPGFQQPQPMYQPPSSTPQPMYQPPSSTPQPPPTVSQYPQGNYSLVALLQATGQFPPAPLQGQQPLQYPGLEALYASQGKPSTPQPPFSAPNFPPNPHLPSSSTPLNFGTPPVSSVPSAAQYLHVAASVQNEVKLNPASLKVHRPQLVSLLYPKLPASQCTTCGRRFAVDTETGKQRKTRHLDAHFRTNMRITDNETRGVGASRSWYIDEHEWVSYRERDDADDADDAEATGHERTGSGESKGDVYADSNGAKAKKRERYIPAPMDAAMRKQACPICQEEFTAVWHDGEQEWVWMDAVKVPVGDVERIYHASCVEEMAKDRGGIGARMGAKRE